MRGFIRFNRGVMKMPLPWRLWLLVLVGLNAVVPLFFLGRLESQLVLGAFLTSMVLFSVLTSRFGFTRLLGLGHLAWIPLLIFLSTRLDAVPGDELFGIWMRALIALNGISLVIDAVDVVRYVGGARMETVRGLGG